MSVKRPSHGVVVGYLALFVAMTGTAAAATGGTFILGKSNVASTTTTLTHSSGGVPLSLQTRSGRAPLKVNSSTKVTNLNVDKLDGIDSSQFQRSVAGSCFYGIASLSASGFGTCTTGDATTLDGLDSAAFRKVSDPLPQGPPGDKGDKGEPGIPGPTNAYFWNTTSSPFGSSGFKTIVQGVVPAGSYVVSAVVQVGYDSSAATTSCDLVANESQVLATGAGATRNQPIGGSSVSLQGAITFADPATVGVRCILTSYSGVIITSSSLSAIRVGTLDINPTP
jgi:hypothetical protein